MYKPSANWTSSIDLTKAAIEDTQKSKNDKSPLIEVDFGELDILEWNYKDFLECPDAHKVVLASKDGLLTVTITDIDCIDFLPDLYAPCQPTIFSKVHLTGEVMPYETYTYVSSIEKTNYQWSENYVTMTLVKTEAETETFSSPIYIKIKEGLLSDKYKDMLKGIKVEDHFRLNATMVDLEDK